MDIDSPWAARRARLSHDVMQNAFAQQLGALENACRGGLVERPDLLDEMRELVDAWTGIDSDARRLIETYENEMSPVRLLERPPLNGMERDDREQLGILVDAMWRKRHGIAPTIESATEVLERIARSLNALGAETATGTLRPEQMAICAGYLAAARRDCYEFADLVRKLPLSQIP